MLKTLGKSALCFAGLVVASWPLFHFEVWFFFLGGEYINSTFLLVLKLTMLPYTLWFLLSIAYAFILFRLFRNDRHRCLIVAMNGLIILLLFLVLWLLQVGSELLSFAAVLVQVYSISVMILALMFKILSIKPRVLKNNSGNIGRILLAFLKSVACLYLYVVLALVACYFTLVTPRIVLFQSVCFVWLAVPILYTSALYLLFRHHKQPMWIIVANVAVIPVISFLASSFYILHSLFVLTNYIFFLIGLVSNTVVISIVLAFIFRSVEKYFASVLTERPLQTIPETTDSTDLTIQ